MGSYQEPQMLPVQATEITERNFWKKENKILGKNECPSRACLNDFYVA